MIGNSVVIPPAGTVNFTERARLAKNFLEQAVDPVTAHPYFDVFAGDPVRLVHDWPDFGDLTARYWEASLMVREMTGEAPVTTDKLRELCLSYLDDDGLSYRPATFCSTNVAEFFDQSRTLSALCSGYMATGDERLRVALTNMVDGLDHISAQRDGYRYFPGCFYRHGVWEGGKATDVYGPDPGYFLATLLRPLAKVWTLTGYQLALDLAVELTRTVVDKGGVFAEDGAFSGHVHSRLAATCGLFVCGDISGNQHWKTLARRAWDYAHSYAGPCGFVPELVGNPAGKLLRSETCAIMDYLDLTILLAKDGDTAKWGDAERIVRNHLIESQLARTDWAAEHREEEYHPEYCDDRAPQRMVGGFAGWSAFDQFFGMTECFTEQWGWLKTPQADPRLYLHHPRLFQNCCGPAGLRALYLAWSQAGTADDNGFTVNLLMSRQSPDGTVAVAENANGAIDVRVTPQHAGPVRVRMPQWANIQATTVHKSGNPIAAHQTEGWLQIDDAQAQETITVTLPCSTRVEEYTVRHGSYPHDHYRITLKGDAAVAIEKTDGIPATTLREISVLADAYPLYQRQAEMVYAAENPPVTGAAGMDWFE